MSVSYKKLWKLLIDKDMNKADLRRATGLSSFTIAKMNNGKDVSTSILKRICEVLKCDVGDILEIRVDQ
jgi:DNA-binding Xre family transcriptional regulator